MTAVNADVIRELATTDTGGRPVTSCYLNVDGRERVRAVDYERDLERLVRRVRDQGNGNGGLDPSVLADLQRIEAFVGEGLDRSVVRGLAMFSSSAAGLWRVVQLPVPVHSRLTVGAAPALSQLTSVVEQLQTIGIVLIDRHQSRILVFSGGEVVEHNQSIEEAPRERDDRGQAERGDLSSHFDELAMQHIRETARVVFDVFQKHSIDRVTLGGAPEAMRELEAELHQYVRDRLVPSLGLGVNASLGEIRSAMLDIEARSERAEEAAAVARLRDAVGAGTMGVAGLAETLAAVEERKVELLLVSDGYEAPGWRCPECSRLAVVGPTCPTCSSEMERTDDVVEEAIQEAIRQSCEIEMCVENADLDVLGRIGAILRY